jgi:uncharacterized protein (DUF2164 family)
MRIRLSTERRATLLAALASHYLAEFDEGISDFRAQGLVDFFVRELGPPVYNQGVRDAIAHLQQRLGDIEGEICEREP